MPARPQSVPSLEAWRTLLVYAETGGVSAAARELNAKQPVVSTKLKVFQKPHDWGTLLTEDKKLTDAAHAILPALRELIRRHDHLIEYLTGINQAPEQIRLGTGHFTSRFYLPRVLNRMQEHLDDCEIHTEVQRGEARILNTAEGTLDLAIVTHSPALIQDVLTVHDFPPNHLCIEALAEHPLGVVARIDSPAGQSLEKLPKRKPVPLEKLAQWELVGLDRRAGIRRRLEESFGPHEIQFIAQGGGWWSALECARAGIGVAIVPLAIVSPEDREELEVRHLDAEFSLQDYLICRNIPLSPFQSALRTALQKCCE